MSDPKRIQLRRTKGWRKPDGAVVVARPSKFGNPFRIVDGWASTIIPWDISRDSPCPSLPPIERRNIVAAEAVSLYRRWMTTGLTFDWWTDNRSSCGTMRSGLLEEPPEDGWNRERLIAPDAVRAAVAGLRGHDLACWCPLGQPCHADVLLEIANQPTPSTSRST